MIAPKIIRNKASEAPSMGEKRRRHHGCAQARVGGDAAA
jgi:hypothetical protein